MDPNSKYIKANINISNKIIQPFYEPPVHCQKTSAEIIKEARVAIKGNIKCFKSVKKYCALVAMCIVL